MEYTLPGADLGAFFSDLVRCETRLYNALNDLLRAQHGIVTSQFEALRYLRDHPDSRVADLAAEFAIGVGATSKGIDRLENNGWAARHPNPADRRSSLLSLTEAGIDLIRAAEQTVTTALTDLLAPLDAWSLATAAHTLARLRSALEHDEIGTPAG